MKMSATDQQRLGVVDEVIPEPADGAHTDPAETGRRLKAAILRGAGATDRDPAGYAGRGALSPVPFDGRVRRAGGPAPTPPIIPPRPGLAERLRNLLEAGQRAIPESLPVGRRDEPPAREDV